MQSAQVLAALANNPEAQARFHAFAAQMSRRIEDTPENAKAAAILGHLVQTTERFLSPSTQMPADTYAHAFDALVAQIKTAHHQRKDLGIPEEGINYQQLLAKLYLNASHPKLSLQEKILASLTHFTCALGAVKDIPEANMRKVIGEDLLKKCHAYRLENVLPTLQAMKADEAILRNFKEKVLALAKLLKLSTEDKLIQPLLTMVSPAASPAPAAAAAALPQSAARVQTLTETERAEYFPTVEEQVKKIQPTQSSSTKESWSSYLKSKPLPCAIGLFASGFALSSLGLIGAIMWAGAGFQIGRLGEKLADDCTKSAKPKR